MLSPEAGAYIMTQERAIVLHAGCSIRFSGRAFVYALQQLAGASPGENGPEPTALAVAVRRLYQRGIAVEIEPADYESTQRQGSHPYRAAGWTVVGEGPLSRALARDLHCNLLKQLPPERIGRYILVAGSLLSPALRLACSRLIESASDHVVVTAGPGETLVTPLFSPEGPCLECLLSRLAANRPIETYAERHALLSLQSPLAVAQLLQGSAYEELLKALDPASSQPPRDCGQTLVRLAYPDFVPSFHSVHNDPSCRTCSSRPDKALRAYTADSDSSPLGPRDLLKHVEPVVGIVRSAACMGDFDLTDRIVVARATQGLPVIDPSDELLKVLLESGAVAAGETADAALTHAVAEAIERWSGAPHDIASNKRRASVLEMGRVPHVHPSQIQLNVPTAARPALPPDLPIDWIAGTSLVAANQIWIPAGSTWLSGTFETDTSFFATTSNGLAAGATRDHATLSALLELIERDAVAIWWYNQLPRPQIDVGSVGGSLVQAASAALARVGRHLWLLDLTFDLGVPVVAAISQRKDQTCEAIAIGFGAALTVEKAVRKSILELWPSVCADPNTTGKASEQLGASRQATRWRETGRLDDWPALVPADAGCRYPVSTKPEHDPSDGIAQVTECLAANGVQPTVVDLTVPAIQVPVVRVVAPGLRPWQPHFAPGRLCQIPVSLGLLDQPKSPGQLAPPPFW